MDEQLAEAVDEAMAPVADEAWEPIRREVRALYAALGVAPMPWDVDDLVARVRARAEQGR